MGKVNALTHLFNAGEISRAALNRVDKEIIRLHAERQENILPYAIGKAIQRPGFGYLSTSQDSNRPRLLPFIKGIDDTALIELTNGSMRVRIDDELVTRTAVDCTVTNGDFDSATGWTTSATTGASATIASGVLTLAAPARGSSAYAEQEVSTDSVGSIHALRIEVTRGPVTLRVGSSSGGDEYISETNLDTGVHSLGFTHTGATSTDSNTVLLLHCDGADGSTSVVDSSDFAHMMTASGNAQLETGNKKFGTASLLFDGASDFVTGDGSTDFAFGTGDFTIDLWVYHTSSGTDQVLYDSRPFSSGSGIYPILYITDNNIIYTSSDFAVTIVGPNLSQNTWNHVAAVRSSGVVTLYANGVNYGSATDTKNYANGSNRPILGAAGVGGGGFIGGLDEVRVSRVARWTENFTPPTAAYAISSNPDGGSFFIRFSTKLEREIVVESVEIEAAGVMTLSAPWSTDQLREIRADQSLDVIFLAHGEWQPRKIERRNNISWSLALYDPEDGPFTVSRTADVRMFSDATHGNITLQSDAPFFESDHVGALFQLNHERVDKEWVLANDEAATDAFRLRGIGTENDWTFAITGTWVGTIHEQRSFDGADTGFTDTGTTHTINASGTAAPGTTYDNSIFWIRYIFKDGNYTSGSAQISVDYAGSGGSGVCRITSFTSDTSVEAEILSDFNGNYSTNSWLEGDWSDHRGWPEAVGFFDGRLWWGRRDQFWGSESDNYYAFNLDTEGDSGSIQRAIATGGSANQIQSIMGLQRLIFVTNSAPMSARSSSFDEPLTPTNITIKAASTEGAARLSPLIIGSRGVYVSADRRRLFELAYDVDAQDYLAKDLTRLHEELADASNPDLFEDAFVELAYQNSPVPYIWAVRDDGIVAGMLFNPSEEARGIFKIATGRIGALDSTRPTDRIVSVAILPRSGEDQVYIAVERTIGDGVGGTERNYYIEKAAYHKEIITRVYDSSTQEISVKNGLKLADSYITATGLGAIGQVFTGLDHLEGRQVIIVGQTVNGGYGPTGTTYTVSGGQITTEEGVEGAVCIGLPYKGFYKSAKLAFAAQQGTALLQKKQVNSLGLALLDTHPHAIRVGPTFEEDDLDDLPRIGGDGLVRDTITLFDRSTEEEPFPFNGYWDTDSRVCLEIGAGYSATLSAMVIGVETKEK